MSERNGAYADRTFFKKSGGRSYLVLRSGEEPELPYQINTIRYNKITGLLPIQFFIEDGEYQYFYDISCKKSLSERMKYKKYSIKEVRTIMSDLYCCVQQMEEYLLDVNCLILDPEYIFSENDTLKLQFCFYQDKVETFEKSLERLFDYFLNQLDYQDEKTVLLVYGLYQKSREERTSLSDLMKQFCEIQGVSSEIKRKNPAESGQMSDGNDTNLYGAEYRKESVHSESDHFDRDIEKKRRLRVHKAIPYRKLIPYIPDIIGGYGIARILWYISRNYTQMSGKTFMVWMFAVAGILAGCGIVSMLLSGGLIKETRDFQKERNDKKTDDIYNQNMKMNQAESAGIIGKKKKTETCERHGVHESNRRYEKNERYDIHEVPEREGMKSSGVEEFCFQDELDIDMEQDGRSDKIYHDPYEQIHRRVDETDISINSVPATVVMNEPELFHAFNPVLVSKDKGKFQDILLKERTVVIGKVRGIADICLEGKSISRVHARINQDEKGCSIVDLGSTNGTFINGVRLQERQRQYLKKGDEIRFAEAVYEFRPVEN